MSYLSADEVDVAKRSAMRLLAFLEHEIEDELPEDHPTALRYERQVAKLRANVGLQPLGT